MINRGRIFDIIRRFGVIWVVLIAHWAKPRRHLESRNSGLFGLIEEYSPARIPDDVFDSAWEEDFIMEREENV
jgi:hypothetical protein